MVGQIVKLQSNVESHYAITVLQKFVTFNNQFNTDVTLTIMKRKIQTISETQLTKKNRLK